MTKLLKPDKNGGFEITLFEVAKSFRAALDGIPSGTYVKLTNKGEVVMSDTPMEKRTNSFFCLNAHGDVLIGGLGIGMIITAIQDKEDVNSIVVLEKHREVIEMITSQISFNSKVHIINADVFTWKPQKGQRFDCVYMDIWNYVNSDVYHEEMKPLKRKYGHYLKPISDSPNRFNRCWAEWNAKNNMRLY
jgi:hypothetical protein